MSGPAPGGAVRPSISPLLWIAAAAWVSSLAGTEVALRCWLDSGAGAYAVGYAATAALVAATALLRPRRLRPVATVCALAFVIAFAHGGWVAATAARLEDSGPRDWDGTVASDPRTGTFGTTIDVTLDSAPWAGTARVTWPKGTEPPPYGARVRLSARIRGLVRQEVSADLFRRAEATRASPWRAAVIGWAPGLLGVVARWRAECCRILLSSTGVGPPLLASMLLGIPASGPAAAAVEDARTAGVAWAVTASGLHLAALVLVAGRFAGVLGLGRRGRAVVTVCAVLLVAVAGGLRLSLIRAALAAAASAFARLVGRRRDATSALGVAVLLLVLPDPSAAFDVGLLLGALALAAIALYAALAQAWLAPVIGRSAARAVGTSLAAQCGVAPLSATLFGGVTLLGPLVLVATTPLAGGAAAVGMAGALALPAWPWGGTATLTIASRIASAAAALWAAVARIPGAFLASDSLAVWAWIVWGAIAVVLWARWPQPRRAGRARFVTAVTVTLTVVTLWAGSAAGPARIEVLDVGQGDAILVRDGTHTLLVDTGPDPVTLRGALARAGVREIDGLVLTHAHDDHIGGLPGLAGVARPDWVGVPDVSDAAVDALAVTCARRADEVVRLRRDMAWTVGRVKVRVLWPRGGEQRLAANDTSVVLLVELGGGRALLLGDAEEQAQRGVLDAWPTPVDMVKVAHHGSPNGNVPTALAVWSPEVALISVGEGNRFGHPSAAALATLREVGARIERTDLDGDLTWSGPVAVEGAGGQTASRVALCDNPWSGRPHGRPPECSYRTVMAWLPETSAISNLSISSTAPRSCCWSGPSGDSGPALPPSPTSISTWRRSTAERPPPTRSSTLPTPCPS